MQSLQYKFGTIIFDDPKSPTSGWASVAGDTASRVQGISELSTDVIWLCNVGRQEFYYKTDLHLNPWLRHDGYLPVNINNILAEWGNDPEQTDRDEMAMFLSELWSRIMEIGKRLLKKNTPDKAEEFMFTGRTLAEDLRFLLPPPEYPKDEAGSILRSGVGYMDYSKVPGKAPKGARMIGLRRPRLDHAIDMLTTPIPRGPFDLYQGADLPSLEELATSPRPILANVVLKRWADPRVSESYAFAGGGINSAYKPMRTWVSQPELTVLKRLCSIDVQNAFIGRDYQELASGIMEFIRQFLESGSSAISWSSGVIADALWQAAALGTERPDRFTPAAERAQTSWRGAWIKGADKVTMFMYVHKLARMGYCVSLYGRGTIYCMVPPERRNDIVLDAWKCGLMPTTRDILTPVSTEKLSAVPWGGSQRSRVQAHLMMMKKSDVRWDLDRLPLAKGDEKQRILQLASEAMR